MALDFEFKTLSMKQILLLRHAKASPLEYDKKDYERKLTIKGITDCQFVSEKLKALGYSPKAALASPSVRTRQTLSIFAEKLEIPQENIHYNKTIYSGLSTQDFLDLLSQTDDRIDSLLFVGHNPDIMRFAYNLTDNFNENINPCTLIILQTSISKWSEIGEKEFELKEILRAV